MQKHLLLCVWSLCYFRSLMTIPGLFHFTEVPWAAPVPQLPFPRKPRLLLRAPRLGLRTSESPNPHMHTDFLNNHPGLRARFRACVCPSSGPVGPSLDLVTPAMPSTSLSIHCPPLPPNFSFSLWAPSIQF